MSRLAFSTQSAIDKWMQFGAYLRHAPETPSGDTKLEALDVLNETRYVVINALSGILFSYVFSAFEWRFCLGYCNCGSFLGMNFPISSCVVKR